jgi:hypothetical protein
MPPVPDERNPTTSGESTSCLPSSACSAVSRALIVHYSIYCYIIHELVSTALRRIWAGDSGRLTKKGFALGDEIGLWKATWEIKIQGGASRAIPS